MKSTQQALGCCFLRAPVRTSFLVSDSAVGLFGGVESRGSPHRLYCKVKAVFSPTTSHFPGAGPGQGPSPAPVGLPSAHKWNEVMWGKCRVDVKLCQRHRDTQTYTDMHTLMDAHT